MLAAIWRFLRGHTQADLTRRLCKLWNWNFGIFWRMFPLIMKIFKNIRELCLAAATDRWKSKKSTFLRVLVKKLESPEDLFLENESSTYQWKRVLRRKKYRWNFEIMFCSIFIREIMAEKSKKRSKSAGKNSSKNFSDTFSKISPILFFKGHFQGSLLKISEPTDVLAGLSSFLKKKIFFRFFCGLYLQLGMIFGYFWRWK